MAATIATDGLRLAVHDLDVVPETDAAGGSAEADLADVGLSYCMFTCVYFQTSWWTF